MPASRSPFSRIGTNPLSELRTGESLVVMALRLWVGRTYGPDQRLPDWREGLQAAGMARLGVPAFSALMRIIAAATYHPLDIRCMSCPELGGDEACLLQILSLLQWDRPREAGLTMAAWLPPTARRMALMPAQGFAAALTQVGLDLPLRRLPFSPTYRLPQGQERTLQ